MDQIVRKLARRPSMVLGGMMLLGMLEFVALQRSQWRNRQVDEQLPLSA